MKIKFDFKNLLKDIFNLSVLQNLIIIFIGSALWSMSVNVFILPNNFLSGGFAGIGMIIIKFVDIPLSWLIIAFNIPISIWAAKELNKRFVIYTAITVIVQSVMLDLFAFLPTYTNQPILAAVFGGVIGGVGIGMIIKSHGSSGGTDVIAIIVRRKLSIRLGTVNLLFNVGVVGLSAIFNGIEPAMFTILNIGFLGATIDKIIEGFNKKYSAMIISDNPNLIKDAISDTIQRGVTFLNGSGGFSNDDKQIIFCVVNQFELAALKDVVKKMDPNSFMTISETSEVLGRFSKTSILMANSTK